MLRVWVLAATGCRSLLGIDPPAALEDAAPIDVAIDSTFDAPAVLIVREAESADRNTATGTSSWQLRTDQAGFTGTAFLQALPQTPTPCTDPSMLPMCAPSLELDIMIDTPGAYHFFARMLGTTAGDDSLWIDLDGITVAVVTTPATAEWVWNSGGTSVELAQGPHTITVWMRESAARVDAIALGTGLVLLP